MRILDVVGSFYPAVGHGGPVTSNRALCGALASLGIEVRVLTTNTGGARKLPREFAGWRPFEGYEIFYGNRWLWRDLSPGLARELGRQVRMADVVHLTGTYNWFLPLAARLCRRCDRPLVVSPRGSLVPEARGSKGLKKGLFDRLIQGKALSRVSAFHATSEAEAEAIRDLVPGARVAVIPNGVEVPGALPERDPEAQPYLLYMGRLHPYKRVERIIRAFAGATAGGVDRRWSMVDSGQRLTTDDRRRTTKEEKTADGGEGASTGDSRQTMDRREMKTADDGLPTMDHGPWTLTIAGDGEAGYRRELERVAEDAGAADRVRFIGHVSGDEKTRLLAQAGFVVQAPNPENFGNVVAEALAHGTPVLVGKGLPWKALDLEGCGFWVDDSEEALAEGMRRLMALSPEERRAMGMRGREWMKRVFSWENVAKQMVGLYEEVRGGKSLMVDGRWKI